MNNNLIKYKRKLMIREANVNDSSRIAEIHVFGWRCAYKEFISMEFLFNKFTVKSREEKFNDLLSIKENFDKTYVFEENDVIKAFMTIGNSRDEDKNEKTYELWGIYVDPIFQRQKIGTQLVNYCIKEAEDKGKEEIILWVFEKNNSSIEFYKRMGFNKDGKQKIMEAFNEKAIRMIKIF
jgi:ribosomal protein S18 acetylase RimI-like enzyme